MNNSADQIEVKLSYDTIEYDKAQAASGGMKPTVTVYVKGSDTQERLIEGTHYSVSYRNNTVPGQASVLITGIEKNHWVAAMLRILQLPVKLKMLRLRFRHRNILEANTIQPHSQLKI